MDPSKVEIPPLKDLTIDNITENVIAINSNNPDPRFKYILERLVVHLHDFARETRLSTQEWMAVSNHCRPSCRGRKMSKTELRKMVSVSCQGTGS